MKTLPFFLVSVWAGANLLASFPALALTSSSLQRSSPVVPSPRIASEAPHVRVLPWNGHRAALTLTFDDGSPSAANEALPVLDERGVKGTFFVTAKNLDGGAVEATWARAEREGHELGNHTVDHCHGPDLGRGRCLSARQELELCNRFIETRLGAQDVYTFAYPFVDQRGGYKRAAQSEFLLARAGKGGLVGSETTPDWYSMDARFIEPSRGQTEKDWNAWIDEADSEKKWLVLVFHSILPEQWFEGIPRSALESIVDHAKASDDLWIDTFVNVGAYLRAERMFEAEHPRAHGRGFVWRWSLPRHFPPGKTLRVALDHGSLRQRGVPLEPDTTNTYTISLDAKSLEWTR
jgi:peptidoglycan/xylan/chitin deacetylase (PgdA/CDA1 family)